MLAYLHKKVSFEANNADKYQSFDEIERLRKCYKGHRDPNCFDSNFIESVLKQSVKISDSDDDVEFEEADI